MQLQVPLALLGVALFNFFDTWFEISLSKVCLFFLLRLGLPVVGIYEQESTPPDAEGAQPEQRGENLKSIISKLLRLDVVTGTVVSIFIVMPSVVGLNLALQFILFGNVDEVLPVLSASLSILASAILYYLWIVR